MTKAKLKGESKGSSGAAIADSGNDLLLREATKIVQALGRMLSPTCEVVLHDLSRPEHAILAIENPLSGRQIGEATTEMGLARVRDPNFPDVVQNYANTLPDGRPTKSTSIGLRNADGVYIAAICLNMDVSLFDTVQRVLERFTAVDAASAPVRETYQRRSLERLREEVLAYAVDLNVQPRALSMEQRRELIGMLADEGLLHQRGAPGLLSDMLGIGRTSIYNALNVTRARETQNNGPAGKVA